MRSASKHALGKRALCSLALLLAARPLAAAESAPQATADATSRAASSESPAPSPPPMEAPATAPASTAPASTAPAAQGSSAASATTPPSRTEVVQPQPVATPVEYPPGASGTAEVVVELVVSATGDVVRVASATGPEPFAAAARAAATSWHFEPALKAGVPVAAKILFLVRFEQETLAPTQIAEEPAAQDAEPAPAAPGTTTSAPMTEIVVVGQLEDPGARTMTRAEVRNLAGAFDDPLRAVEVMPGVTPIATFLPLFFVRGAPPGNVGFYFDEVRIPLLYHAFLGPSVIHPAMISQVTLHGGPMPVRFGRYAGAVVDASLATPELDSPQFPWRGEANIRLLDAGAYVEAPWADGRGYTALAGRYSYTALLLSMVSPDQQVDYWDYQGLVGYHLTPRDTVSVLGFGAYDYAGSKTTDDAGGTEFHRIDLRYDHEFSSRTKSRVAATWGRDRTRSSSGFVSDDMIAGRARIEHQTTSAVFRAGGDISYDRYELEVDAAVKDPLEFMKLFPTRDDLAFGAYADVVLWPEGRVTVTPGVRADFYSSMGETASSVDPRISATFRLTPEVRTNHALGTAHQSPNFVPSVPGAQVGGLPGGLQKSLQWESSVEADLPWELTSTAGIFINQTQDLSDPIGLSQSLDIDEESADRRAYSRAAGIELMLERPLTRRLGGLVSYTYSRATRAIDAMETVPGYERPHVFNGALSYDLGGDLRASTKLVVASGVPGRRVTPAGEFVFDEDARSFPFVRLDAKLSKRWHPSPYFWWGSYVEVLNATHGTQVVRRVCNPSGCRDEGTGPITVPSIGLEAGWR